MKGCLLTATALLLASSAQAAPLAVRTVVDVGQCNGRFTAKELAFLKPRGEGFLAWVGPCADGFAHGPGMLFQRRKNEGVVFRFAARYRMLGGAIDYLYFPVYGGGANAAWKQDEGKNWVKIKPAGVPAWAKYVVGKGDLTFSQMQDALDFLEQETHAAMRQPETLLDAPAWASGPPLAQPVIAATPAQQPAQASAAAAAAAAVAADSEARLAAQRREREGNAMAQAIAQRAAAMQRQNDEWEAKRRAERERIQRDNERFRRMRAEEERRWLEENQRQQQAALERQRMAQDLERQRREQALAQQRQAEAADYQRRQAEALRRQQEEQRAQQEARRRRELAEASVPRVESYFRNNLYYLRNNGSRRVLCQVSAMLASSGIGARPGLQPYQKAITLWPNSEEAPFSGPVGNPRFFGCRVM